MVELAIVAAFVVSLAVIVNEFRKLETAVAKLESRVSSLEAQHSRLVAEINEIAEKVSRFGNAERRRIKELSDEARHLSADDGVVYLGPLNGTHADDSDEEI